MAVTTLRIKVGEQWYTVEIGDLNQSPLEVTVEGETFYVEVEGLAHPATGSRRGRPSQRQAIPPAAPASGRSAPSASGDKILRSPMPGRVISIMVRPGDHVAAGVEVLASVDASCLLHLRGLAERQDSPLRFMHVAEILAGRTPGS